MDIGLGDWVDKAVNDLLDEQEAAARKMSAFWERTDTKPKAITVTFTPWEPIITATEPQ